ncbi:MAG: tRNA pseudouridine(55) synthase TruB [Pseudomonadota bacterium]
MGQRRKKGRPINGWLVLDKDYDLGSTEAVSKLKWLYRARKVGHAGTLDPLATGILPIAFGEATKTVPFITDAKKTYQFTAQWGASTSTDDTEGEVLETSDTRPTKDAIVSVLPSFTGLIRQRPPRFSAVRINGERAYDLAREGVEAELPIREITIDSLKIIDTPSTDLAHFEAVTGKGAYVRALVRDMAEALGTVGHVVRLRRTSVGPFSEEQAVTLADLEALEDGDERDNAILPIEAALSFVPKAAIDGPGAGRLRNGQPALLTPAKARGVRAGEIGEIPSVVAMEDHLPVAICELDGLKLKPLRVFNFETS